VAKLKIYKFPDVVLAKRAKPIERVDKTFYKVADDMLETMYFAPGIGLAANQVGLLERIVVIDTDYDSFDPEEGEFPPEHQMEGSEVINGKTVVGKNPIILINPEIIYREGINSIEEACLSVPDYAAEVQRAEKIRVKYKNIDGLEKELSAEGLLAICIQHELDHLDGRLFIDRLNPLKRDSAKRRLLKNRKELDEE
jgi:peptide deformylase